MTPEELYKYKELVSKFESECVRVGKIISSIDPTITTLYGDAKECDRWEMACGLVIGTGLDIFTNRKLYCSFPIELLTKSDSELIQYVIDTSLFYKEWKRERDEKRKV
jgi:hypothetical protein